MLTNRSVSRVALVVVASLGFLTSGHADPFGDRLKTDPTAIARPKSTMQPMDTEITRSLREAGEADIYATPMCSYDVYYWNTIYACDPAHQGRVEYDHRGNEDR